MLNSEKNSRRKLLERLVDEAAHLLPCQAPLQSFVHHNTLHNFENLYFKDALKKAAELFGSESFMNEDFFRKAIAEERITQSDITKIITQECKNSDEKIFENGPTFFAFRNWRLNNLFTVPTIKSVDWWLFENKTFTQPHPLSAKKTSSEKDLRALWRILAPENFAEKNSTPLRLRDKIFRHCNIDIDELVNPLLIKLSAAYLDQGIAFNTMPQRNEGFLTTFRKIYRNNKIISESWMKDLAEECAKQEEHYVDATDSILKTLGIFGISESDWKKFILETLLALRGWAGMFYQFETSPQRIPVNFLPAKIIDFLAVKLILELCAIKFVLKKIDSDFEKISRLNFADDDTEKKLKILQYEAFVAAQAFGIPATNFDRNSAKKWLKEIANFNDFERRYFLCLAYENHYHKNILGSLIAHQKFLNSGAKEKKFQAVFCMDEREESFRRHLEEICPSVETFGFAGFFGVAMQFKGLDDIRPLPLCPVVISPEIFVEEIAIDEAVSEKYVKTKKIFGRIENFKRNVRKSMIYGAIWSFIAGIFKIFPLIGRSLFPLQTTKILNHFHWSNINKPKTRLVLERVDETEKKFGFKVGFSIDEMSNIVFSVLDAMDLKKDFAPLVIMIGHGSSSMNNPHESAYNCGATGGGRGSANARAFALMANDDRVRRNLKTRGITIPHSTIFIGGYHDTCNDALSFFDTDSLEKNFAEKLFYAKSMLEKAATYNAHERSRRFDSVPKNANPKEAKTYVEQRAIDLAQPRPEYGHGTNAICIIGRREKTAGLFLDRRAFLISYNPKNDPSGDVLTNILGAAIPVGAGISLEYYFSSVDPTRYGCNTKLPHNVTGLIGVMDGPSSDLRTGLPWQTVELHEPMRLLTIIESTPEILNKITEAKADVKRLVENDWIKLVAWDADSGILSVFENGKFVNFSDRIEELPIFSESGKHYSGKAAHLNCANIIN